MKVLFPFSLKSGRYKVTGDNTSNGRTASVGVVTKTLQSDHYFIQTGIVNICLILLASLCACQNAKAPKQVNTESENYENKFFTLNFESDNSGISDFKNQFFTTFPHNDPTLGDVVYDKARWIQGDMINVKEKNGLFAYVKYREDDSAFDSFRFTTKAYFNLNEKTKKILFVFKGSLPSKNGMWPAWWLNGSREDTWIYKDDKPALTDELLNRYSGKGNFYDTPSSVNNTDWPGAGEVDIIENINGNDKIHNTLHTCPQMCDSEWNNDGVVINCANSKPGDVNPGCSGRNYEIEKLEGTFACLWEPEAIGFYYWEPGSELVENGGPLSSKPNPDLWTGNTLKNTVKLIETDTPCNVAEHQSWQCENCTESNSCRFQNMKMIFNVTLCGVWAGNKFDDTPDSFNNCKEYIMGEGKDEIDNQFMKIEYVSVQKI